MTSEEHTMLIILLTDQRKAIATIWEALKSKDLVGSDDIPAFESVTEFEDIGKAEHFRQTIANYWKAATICNVPLPPHIEALGKGAFEWNPKPPL